MERKCKNMPRSGVATQIISIDVCDCDEVEA